MRTSNATPSKLSSFPSAANNVSNRASQSTGPAARTMADWLNYANSWIPCRIASGAKPIYLNTSVLSNCVRDMSQDYTAICLAMLSVFHGDAQPDRPPKLVEGGLEQRYQKRLKFHFNTEIANEKKYFKADCQVSVHDVVTDFSVTPTTQPLFPAPTLANAQAALDEISRKISNGYGAANFASDPMIMGSMLAPYTADTLIRNLQSPASTAYEKLAWIIELNHRADFGRCASEEKARAVIGAQAFLDRLHTQRI